MATQMSHSLEADGGAWKNAAVANIKNYLESKLYGYGVVVLA